MRRFAVGTASRLDAAPKQGPACCRIEASPSSAERKLMRQKELQGRVQHGQLVGPPIPVPTQVTKSRRGELRQHFVGAGHPTVADGKYSATQITIMYTLFTFCSGQPPNHDTPPTSMLNRLFILLLHHARGTCPCPSAETRNVMRTCGTESGDLTRRRHCATSCRTGGTSWDNWQRTTTALLKTAGQQRMSSN